MFFKDPRMSCWYIDTLHGLLSSYEHSLLLRYRYLTELKWQTNICKYFYLIGTAGLCHRNIEVHEYCRVALFFLFTWIIPDIILMFILLEVFSLDLWCHVRSQSCWNRVEQPPVPAYLFQSLLSATKCWYSWLCNWCGWKNKMEEAQVSCRERGQATKVDTAVEEMYPKQEL